MGKRKEGGAVEIHLRFYPEKYEAHRIIVEQMRQYQETMGVGPNDALAAMLYPVVKEMEERKTQEAEKSSEKKEAKQGSRIESDGKEESRKPEQEAGSPSMFQDEYAEGGFFGSGFSASDFFGGSL